METLKWRMTVLLPLALWVGYSSVFAHCDTMNGPVVKAAQAALESGEVNLVLIWVQEQNEAEIKEAFEKTLQVRKLNPSARDLADRYFFETVVRLHRAGEGEPYTGLKPAGEPIEPGIAAADKTLEKESVEELSAHLSTVLKERLGKLYSDVRSRKGFPKNDIRAGREYVRSYVLFIHFVESLVAVLERPMRAHGHGEHESGE